MTTDRQKTDPDGSGSPVDDEQTTDAREVAEDSAEAQDAAQRDDSVSEGEAEHGADEDSGGDAEARASREAAKWRKQLRATEAERDLLAGQVEALQRAAVESASSLQRPAALWLTDAAPADLIHTDTGEVDAEALRAAEHRAADEYGLRHKRDGNHVPREGNSPSVQGDPWTEAFR